MRLPEPARTTFLAGWPEVRDAAFRAGIATEDVALGGGTTLAARWRHRRSVALDLVLDSAPRLNAWYEQLIDGSLPSEGWKVDYNPRLGKVILTEPEHVHPRSSIEDRGRFDIWCTVPIPPEGAALDDVEGHGIPTLANLQILGGKLDRVMSALPRDLVDVVFAGDKDPRSLELALYRWPPEAADTIARVWEREVRAWASKEWDTIELFMDVSRNQARDIIGRAPGVLRDSAFASLVMEKASSDFVRVVTTTVRGVEREVEVGLDEFRPFLSRSGFARRFGVRMTDALDRQAASSSVGETLYREIGGRDVTAAR